MARTPRFSMAQIAAALEQSAGIRLGAATLLKCSPTTIKNYVDRSKSLQRLEAEIVERNLDAAEGKVLEAIKDGNLTAAIFYLKTKGKHRGYSERHQVEGKDGGPVEVQAKVDFSDLSPAGLKFIEAVMDRLRETVDNEC